MDPIEKCHNIKSLLNQNFEGAGKFLSLLSSYASLSPNFNPFLQILENFENFLKNQDRYDMHLKILDLPVFVSLKSVNPSRRSCWKTKVITDMKLCFIYIDRSDDLLYILRQMASV